MTTKIHADIGIEFPDGSVQSTAVHIPSGAIMDFAMIAAPAGWLVCDGAAVSRIAYAALFAAIGTTWGAGDGSTTFNLPDMRGRYRATLGTDGTSVSKAFAQKLSDDTKPHLHNLRTANTGITGGFGSIPYSPGDNNGKTVIDSSVAGTGGTTNGVIANAGTETRPYTNVVQTCIKV